MGRKTLAKKVAPARQKRSSKRKKTPVVELVAVDEPVSEALLYAQVITNQLNLFD